MKKFSPFSSMVKTILLTGFLSLYLASCSNDPEVPFTDTEIKIYYNEVALHSEFGSIDEVVKKWNTNMKIFVSGDVQDNLDKELDKIIDEINSLTGVGIKLERVDDLNDANFHIFLGSADDYVIIEPNAQPYVASNWGLFWIYWDNSYTIFKGSLYVDVVRTTDINAQKHLLREELTQSLGLINDSYSYANSIFYQPWTTVTTYAPIDKEVIKIHHDSRVHAGMTATEVDAVIDSILL